MGVIIKDNKHIIITEPKSLDFNIPKDVDKILKHEIDFIIKQHEFLAEQAAKNEISRLLFNYKHGIDIHEHEKQQNE